MNGFFRRLVLTKRQKQLGSGQSVGEFLLLRLSGGSIRLEILLPVSTLLSQEVLREFEGM